MERRILVGTASWTDPGFVADWYPAKLPAGERLKWYSDQFNMVELNSSFYALPTARQVERWCHEVPRGFIFNVKLHRLLSRHSTTVQTLPPELRKLAEVKNGKVQSSARLETEVAKQFVREIEPFRQNGNLGALLLQLSPSFSPRANSLSDLENVIAALKGYDIGVELRNRGWATDENLPRTEEFFSKHKLIFVCVDAPDEKHFMILPSIDVVTNPKAVYLRLHGRDAKAYTTGKTVAERFNYDYSDEELTRIADRAMNLSKQAEEVHIVFNNNAHDYAPRNAARFRELFAQRFPAASRQLLLGAGQPKAAANQEMFSFVKT